MNAARPITHFDYQLAEEIVVHLAGITAFDLASCREIAPHELPAWTIGDITARFDHGDAARYVIRFRHHGATLIAAIPAIAIEGTA